MLTLTPTIARQIAITAQRLGEPQSAASKAQMLDVLRSIRCLQLDPIRAVERTQHLVLWSRLGQYNREWLRELTYQDKALFEFWAHAASIVLSEDFPIHQRLMRTYATDPKKRLHQWVAKNENFKRYVLAELDKQGPLLTAELEDCADVPWGSSGWTNDRSLPYMLDYLWTKGVIGVADRDGLKRWWDLTERLFPSREKIDPLSAAEVDARAIPLAVKALGIGRERDIRNHFIEKRYSRQLKDTLNQLVKNGILIPAQIPEWGEEVWYLAADDLGTVERLKDGQFYPRTTLLSPFDGLIRDRDRTELLWDFYYRIEIYVPKAKRQFGYYVLPILHGDRLIGRIDSKIDRKSGIYHVYTVYTERWFKPDKESGRVVKAAIQDLGQFIGAKKINYENKRPRGWQSVIK